MKPNWLNQISYRVVGLSSHRVLSNFQRQPHFRVVLTEEARLEKWLWHESLSFFLFVLFSVPITNLSKFTTTCALLCGHTHTHVPVEYPISFCTVGDTKKKAHVSRGVSFCFFLSKRVELDDQSLWRTRINSKTLESFRLATSSAQLVRPSAGGKVSVFQY